MNIEVLRVDGTREQHVIPKHNAIRAIHKLIGRETGDAVNLRDGRVMICDDNGWETEIIQHPGRIEIKAVRPKKPINPQATRIYQGLCRPGTTHQIAGDVAIAMDKDFA